MNDDDLRQQIARGVQMRSLAEGPGGLFEVLSQVRLAYLETIVDTKPTDSEGREALYHRLKAHDDIITVMKDVIKEGHNAAAMLDNLTKKLEKKVPNVA